MANRPGACYASKYSGEATVVLVKLDYTWKSVSACSLMLAQNKQELTAMPPCSLGLENGDMLPEDNEACIFPLSKS